MSDRKYCNHRSAESCLRGDECAECLRSDLAKARADAAVLRRAFLCVERAIQSAIVDEDWSVDDFRDCLRRMTEALASTAAPQMVPLEDVEPLAKALEWAKRGIHTADVRESQIALGTINAVLDTFHAKHQKP